LLVAVDTFAHKNSDLSLLLELYVVQYFAKLMILPVGESFRRKRFVYSGDSLSDFRKETIWQHYFILEEEGYSLILIFVIRNKFNTYES
jgi:hypothetical protein